MAKISPTKFGTALMIGICIIPAFIIYLVFFGSKHFLTEEKKDQAIDIPLYEYMEDIKRK